MRPYSLDLRERIVAAVDRHEGSIRWIAHIFLVSTSFIVRLLQRRRDAGTLAPEPHRGGPPQALGPADWERLAALVRQDPDATLEQLRERGGFSCSVKTLWYALDDLGLTLKKKSLHATQRDRPDVKKKRRKFRREVATIEPEKLVFVDESGATTTMTPTYARAPRGERAVDAVPASWETVTLTAALGLDGVRAPMAFVGATDTPLFEAYTEQVLAPALHEGDVVVWDNIKPHQSAEAAAAVERAGAGLLPLPPYSPEYSPIEEMFSKVKQGLRRAKARGKEELYEAMAEVMRSVTPEDILGWFRHAGLCAAHG